MAINRAEQEWPESETVELDTFACGLTIARGTRVVMHLPYRQDGTYLYPCLGVSSLTNAAVQTSMGIIQYPAELLDLNCEISPAALRDEFRKGTR